MLIRQIEKRNIKPHTLETQRNGGHGGFFYFFKRYALCISRDFDIG
jgi:hypothetical protein